MFFDLRIYRYTRRSMGSSHRLCQGYQRHVTSIPCFLKPQIVSEVNVHVPLSRIQKTPTQGFWRSDSEVHVLRLRIRFVGQDLVCVHSDGFGSCFLTWVYFFNDSHRSTLHTFLYVSFASAAHDVCSFVNLIVLTWHCSLVFFLFGCVKKKDENSRLFFLFVV